jgi:hypothetical protein
MNNRSTATWIVGIACCLPLVTLSQSGSFLLKLRMNVLAEKKDTVLNFKEGSVGSMGGDGSEYNGFSGTSNDMGDLLRTIIILDQNIPEDRAGKMADFQFRLEGAVKCKRIRRGDLPDIPYGGENPHDPTARVHVLADGCAIISVNH